jgi:tetratricopeptide (TPR) repeat protein
MRADIRNTRASRDFRAEPDTLRNRHGRKAKQPVPFRLWLTPLLVFSVGLAAAGEDPQALQQRAIARIDAYVEYFRRTFDSTALQEERKRAEGELKESIRLFRGRGQPGPAAYSMVKLGDLYRHGDRWDAAIEMYEQGLQAARQGKDPRSECKALLGQARSFIYGKRETDRALTPIEQAVQPAKEWPSRLVSSTRSISRRKSR